MTTWVVTADHAAIRIVDVDADSKPIRLSGMNAEEATTAIKRLVGDSPIAVDAGGYGHLVAGKLARRGIAVTTFNLNAARSL